MRFTALLAAVALLVCGQAGGAQQARIASPNSLSPAAPSPLRSAVGGSIGGPAASGAAAPKNQQLRAESSPAAERANREDARAAAPPAPRPPQQASQGPAEKNADLDDVPGKFET